MNRLGILYVVDYFPPHKGGIETMFDALTKEIAKRHDVTIVTIRMPNTPEFEISSGRKIYRLNIQRWLFPLASFKVAELAKDADIIHTSSFTSTFATLIPLFLGKRIVVTVHELWGKMWNEFYGIFPGIPYRIAEKLFCIFYGSKHTTCPSEYTKRAMLKIGFNGKKIQVIPHGIDHKIFNENIKPSEKFSFPTYMFLGRPGKSKGLEYLMEAVKLIEEDMPQAKLVLMVSNDEKDKLLPFLQKGMFLPFMKTIRDFRDRVVWIKPAEKSEDVAKIMRSVDCIVVPSVSEGFGFVAVEAQACGIPVVASDAGSLPEVVKGGILVPPRDPIAIANAVLKILRDKRFSNKLSEIGVRWTQRYQWPKAVEQYEKIYENLRR